MRSGAGRLAVRLLLTSAGILLATPPAAAQVRRPTPRPPAPAPRPSTTPAARADSIKADSAKADTSKAELIKWTELDSTASALVARPGYAATRSQGVRVRFDA
jgi:hypothetical protein